MIRILEGHLLYHPSYGSFSLTMSKLNSSHQTEARGARLKLETADGASKPTAAPGVAEQTAWFRIKYGAAAQVPATSSTRKQPFAAVEQTLLLQGLRRSGPEAGRHMSPGPERQRNHDHRGPHSYPYKSCPCLLLTIVERLPTATNTTSPTNRLVASFIRPSLRATAQPQD